MKNSIIHSPESYVSMPWKNGMGTTIELIKRNSTPECSFDWRISMAEVVEDGPFSVFEGYDRTLVLLTGLGISLATGNQEHILLSEQLDVAQFRGDDDTLATLQQGPITDFNIMSNRTHCRANVDVGLGNTPSQTLRAHCDELLIFSVDTQINFKSDGLAAVKLPGGHLFQTENVHEQLFFEDSAKFIAVQINYLS